MKTFAQKTKRASHPVHRTRAAVLPFFNPTAQVQRAKVRQVLRAPRIQAKLTIGQPNDKYEQEADRIADEVMRMPEPAVQRQSEDDEKKQEELIQTKPLGAKITPLVQRQEKPEEEEILQPKAENSQSREVTPDLESRIESLKGGGQPLSEADRSFMEKRFGVDFSGVRLHTDSNAAQMSGELDAQAFTYGRNIYFGSGRYSPDILSGKRLLAHELAHVIQQQAATRIDRLHANKYYKASPMFSHSERVVQLLKEKYPTKWAGGDTTFTTDDSYVEIVSTAWGKILAGGKWNKCNYPKNSVCNLGNPFGRWSEIGTYLEIHDHRDFSPDVDEHWTVWVYWPVIKKDNIIGKGSVDIKGKGRHAVLSAEPIEDKSTKRLGTKFKMLSGVGGTSEVSVFGTIGGSTTVSGGAFTRTWWLKYEEPKAVPPTKIIYMTSVYFPVNSTKINDKDIKLIYLWLHNIKPASILERIKAGKAIIKVKAYASTTASIRYNLELSRKRRDKVVKLLRDFLGTKADIHPTASGELEALKRGHPDEKENPSWRKVRIEIEL